MNGTFSKDILNTVNHTSINRSDIEGFIGQGINHLVFKYKKNKVIKIPKNKGALTYSNSALLKDDLRLINSYFPGLAPNTKILSDQQNASYVIIQDLCTDGTEISGEMVNHVRPQLEVIIKQNKKLFKRTGRSLDLFGSTGFTRTLLSIFFPKIKPHLSNILMKKVGSSYRLLLVDAELLRLKVGTQKMTSVPLWFQSWVSFVLTSFLLKTSFKFTYA